MVHGILYQKHDHMYDSYDRHSPGNCVLVSSLFGSGSTPVMVTVAVGMTLSVGVGGIVGSGQSMPSGHTHPPLAVHSSCSRHC